MRRRHIVTPLSQDKAELDEVRRFHAPMYHKWKSRRGLYKVTDDPAFRDSVISLAEQGYTLDEMGAFIGLSRERIRQQLASWGLRSKEMRSGRKRIFDWELGQFVNCPHWEYKRLEYYWRAERRKDAAAAEVAERMALVRLAIEEHCAKYGGMPKNLFEIATALGLKGTRQNKVNSMYLWLGAGVYGDLRLRFKTGRKRLEAVCRDLGVSVPDGRCRRQ